MRRSAHDPAAGRGVLDPGLPFCFGRPEGSPSIVSPRPRAPAPSCFTDVDGHRFQCSIADQDGLDVARWRPEQLRYGLLQSPASSRVPRSRRSGVMRIETTFDEEIVHQALKSLRASCHAVPLTGRGDGGAT